MWIGKKDFKTKVWNVSREDSDGVTPDGTKILKLSKKFSCVKYPCTIILIEKKMFKISHFSVHIDAAYHIVCRLF